MKTKLLFLAILAVSAVYAQTTGQQGSVPYLIVLHYQGIPADGCDVLHEAINDQTGDRYGCNAGSWNKVSGLPAGLTSPSGVPCVVSETPSGGVAGAYGCNLPGLPNREVSGATDTILSTDCNPGIVRYIGSASVAVTLPTATTLAVPNCPFSVVNATTGSLTAVTVTPTTWTVNGLPSIQIGQGQTVRFSVAASGAAWRADLTNNGIINAAITYFVCAKAVNGTCVYNGDAGTVTTGSCPSDSCDGLTKATPKLTIDGARQVIANIVLLAVATIQLADTAGTATDCYRPNATGGVNDTWQNQVQGYNPTDPWERAIGTALQYPAAYIWIHGNDTTSSNVLVTGATTCTGTTPSAGVGLRFVGTIARVSGIQFKLFTENGNNTVSAGVTGLRSVLYIEDDNYDGGSTGDSQLVDGVSSIVIYGSGTQTMTINNGGAGEVGEPGSTMRFVSPLGRMKMSITGTAIISPGFFLANDFGYIQPDAIASLSVTSSAVANVWNAIDSGRVNWSDSNTFVSPAQTITYSGANLTLDRAQRGGYVRDACRTVGQLTCNFTSFAAHAKADTNSFIQYLAGANTGNTVDSTSHILGAVTLSGTGACATLASQTGADWTGSVQCTGTTGASTLTITFPAAAPNGWNCPASDRTAGTSMPESASAATTCTVKGTVTQNDVLVFSGGPF